MRLKELRRTLRDTAHARGTGCDTREDPNTRLRSGLEMIARPAWPQDALHFAHHLVVLFEMLERFEADHHVHRVVRDWNRRAVPAANVSSCRRYLSRACAQQQGRCPCQRRARPSGRESPSRSLHRTRYRGPAELPDELLRETVPMDVLQPDVAGNLQARSARRSIRARALRRCRCGHEVCSLWIARLRRMGPIIGRRSRAPG